MQYDKINVGDTVGVTDDNRGGAHQRMLAAKKATVVSKTPAQKRRRYGDATSAKIVASHRVEGYWSETTQEAAVALLERTLARLTDPVVTQPVVAEETHTWKGSKARWMFRIEHTVLSEYNVASVYPWAECERLQAERDAQRQAEREAHARWMDEQEKRRAAEQAARDAERAAIAAEDAGIIELYKQALLNVVPLQALKDHPPAFHLYGKLYEREMQSITISPELFTIITSNH